MAVLVIAEHDNHRMAPATEATVTAALALSDQVSVLVAGCDCDGVAEEIAALRGVSEVRLARAPHYAHALAENLAPLIRTQAKAFSHVLAPATPFGSNVLPRVAALLGVEPVTDVIAIDTADTFRRPIYAGNVCARIRSTASPILLTVRATAFSPTERGQGRALITNVQPGPAHPGVKHLRTDLIPSSRPDLSIARAVVAGGRGLGSRENYHRLLGPLADVLGAALGASRAAVDAGYVSNDLLIGQSGKIVAPDLYIAVGISGSLQHVAGIRGARAVVAINADAEAPIMRMADYALQADLFQAVPQLTEALKSA